jgi:hypothetical protein
MTQAESEAGFRLARMAPFLLALAAQGQQPATAAPREVVTGDDAVDAVLQVAIVIDEAVTSGAIPAERGMHAQAMLMLVREYVRPLPPGLGADGTDMVGGDLHALARALRRTSSELGFQG